MHRRLLPLLLWSTAAFAQGAPPQSGRAGAPPSTLVHPDGTVTFSLAAPEASQVELSAGYPITRGGGYGPQANRTLPMAKDAKGVWSITVPALPPGLYSYGFAVDGVTVNDPRAPFTMNRGASTMFVHGPAAANFEMADVPHGTVAQVWYPSPAYGAINRRMVVYTPPGYEASKARYLVLYLLHGGGGDELSWSDSGRAPQIFDNLIAKGRMVPAIVVMPNGSNRVAGYSNRETTLPAAGREPPVPGGNARVTFLDSLLTEIIPFVDRTYRTRADAASRAVAGYSGGAGESVIVATNNLDRFAWVGAFSPGWPDVPADFNASIPKPADADLRRGPGVGELIDPAAFQRIVPLDAARANTRLRLFYLGVGDADGLLESVRSVKALLDEKGVRYRWTETHDQGHDMSLWRMNLEDFACQLFRPKR